MNNSEIENTQPSSTTSTKNNTMKLSSQIPDGHMTNEDNNQQHHHHYYLQQQHSPLHYPHHHNREGIDSSQLFTCPFSHDNLNSDNSHHFGRLSLTSSSISSSSSSSNMDDDDTTAFATAQLDSLLRKNQLIAEIHQSTQYLERINANRKACAVDFEYKEELKTPKRKHAPKSKENNHSNSPESDEHNSRSHHLLRSIYNAQLSAALHMENPSKLFLDLLNEVITLISCQYSFIGELKYTNEGKPFLHSHAISFARMKLTQESLDLFQQCTSADFKFNNMGTLFGHTLLTGKPVLTNDPKNHPYASPNHIPPGHPPLNNFLGLPFIFNNKLVGMIGLANKEGGFHEEDIVFLEPICTTCATIIVSWQYFLEREEAKENLKLANLNLEQRIEERTEELLRSNIKLKEEVEQRRKAEQELLEQRKISEKIILEKEQFLRNVSHDCRTPLSCILGLSDLLLGSSDRLSNDHYEYLTMIKNSGETMLSLINDFLDLMKLEQHMKLNSEYFFPNEPFEEVIDLIVLECIKKNIELVFDYKPDFPFNTVLNSDKGRFKQVLLNLLSNAVKFTDEGYIYVGVQLTKNNGEAQIEIEVRDTGIGIEKENLPRIGQPFLQFNTSHHPQQKGTGLGVSISKMIANALGGNLKAESEGANKGSSFIFTCKTSCKEIDELSLEDRALLEKKSNKHIGLFSMWKSTHHTLSEIHFIVLDKNTLFSQSLKHFSKSFNATVGYLKDENFTICNSKQTLIESISSQLLTLDRLDKLIIIVDVKQLEEETGQSIQSICQELQIPIENVETTAGDGKKIQVIPSIVFSSMGCFKNPFLTKPIFKLSDFTRVLKPHIFSESKPNIEKRPILAEEELLKIAGHFSVLVVDDNMINSKVLSHILIKLGLQKIEIASSGEEAIEKVKNTYFNIIFLDLFMDGMDGFETSRIINQTCKENAPNIVLLTANIVNKKEEEQLMRNGVKYFMSKPTRFSEIRQLVLDIVRK